MTKNYKPKRTAGTYLLQVYLTQVAVMKEQQSRNNFKTLDRIFYRI